MVEGYNVVKAIESCGSRSGDTAFDVMIADCGQLEGGELQLHAAVVAYWGSCAALPVPGCQPEPGSFSEFPWGKKANSTRWLSMPLQELQRA